MYHYLFNMWPETTPLLPVWPRRANRLDTALEHYTCSLEPALAVRHASWAQNAATCAGSGADLRQFLKPSEPQKLH